jgi:hypothetical protein
MLDKLDLLVVSVPVLDLQYPPSSPAVIKACAKSAGFQAKTADYNILLRDICGSREKFFSVQYNFENVSTTIQDTNDAVKYFFDNDHDVIQQWLSACIADIREKNPNWLGVSVFSYKSHKAALLLCDAVKKALPSIKIVLGGRGASSYALGPDHLQFVNKLKKYFGKYYSANFADTLLKYSVVDKVIHGDGEQAIVDLLEGLTEDNITGAVERIDLEQVPFVDFDDYDITTYDYVNEPIIPITGSKGCVRQCTFCDIPVLWPKFKFRSGDHIAKEMIHLQNKHNVNKFYMSDSLVNGSLKAFNDFIRTLAEYNNTHPDRRIKWVGQYITRPVSNNLNDEYYDLLKASGGEGLTIGIESGSDAVREHMKKKFTTQDVDAELEQFDRRGIVCVLLFFSCYPTETWQNFLDTVDMFIRYQKYCASGTVYKLTLGTPYTHHQQTPLWNMQEDIGLTTAAGSDILWLLKDNPELTFYERIRRRLILQEVATCLRLPMSRNTAELNQLKDSLILHYDSIKEFFGPLPKIIMYRDLYNLTPYDNLLMPEDLQLKIKQHLNNNPSVIEKIISKYANINDDIQFDNQSYSKLKEVLLNGVA